MRIRAILGAGAAAALLAGCVDYGVGYYGPGPAPNLAYDVWYDGHYGPIYDGYWASDGGGFIYRKGPHAGWRRGSAKHFRRDAKTGFSRVQGQVHDVSLRP
jgi:hypothetical protein